MPTAGGGSISRVELRRMFLQSPSYTGPENDVKAKKIWARQSLEMVFKTSAEFLEEGDLTMEGFEYACERHPTILAAFDLGVKKKPGTM